MCSAFERSHRCNFHVKTWKICSTGRVSSPTNTMCIVIQLPSSHERATSKPRPRTGCTRKQGVQASTCNTSSKICGPFCGGSLQGTEPVPEQRWTPGQTEASKCSAMSRCWSCCCTSYSMLGEMRRLPNFSRCPKTTSRIACTQVSSPTSWRKKVMNENAA